MLFVLVSFALNMINSSVLSFFVGIFPLLFLVLTGDSPEWKSLHMWTATPLMQEESF